MLMMDIFYHRRVDFKSRKSGIKSGILIVQGVYQRKRTKQSNGKSWHP
jgi:hypothetical protein